MSQLPFETFSDIYCHLHEVGLSFDGLSVMQAHMQLANVKSMWGKVFLIPA